MEKSLGENNTQIVDQVVLEYPNPLSKLGSEGGIINPNYRTKIEGVLVSQWQTPTGIFFTEDVADPNRVKELSRTLNVLNKMPPEGLTANQREFLDNQKFLADEFQRRKAELGQQHPK